MSRTLPFDAGRSPTVILELIHRLRVSDVMSRNLVVARRGDSLRHLQSLMRENGITGVPIAEGKRLLGLVTVDTIFRALEQGSIEEPADRWMTRNTVVLEEEMPLSLGLSSMEKYRYGRFPVLNRDRELVGIITSRDVLRSLLVEINKEVERLEGPSQPQVDASGCGYSAEFPIRKYDLEHAGTAASELKQAMVARGIPASLVRRAAIAAYELEMNLVLHSDGGRLLFELGEEAMTIVATDTGPGIADTSVVMEEGYSTASEWIRSLGFGAGMGLPNVRRVSDRFSIVSKMDVGTEVRAEICLTPHEQQADGGAAQPEEGNHVRE